MSTPLARSRKAPGSTGSMLLIGMASGIAGAWAMTQFNRFRVILTGAVPQPLPYSAQEWDSTRPIAEFWATKVLHRQPTRAEVRIGAQIVHYAVGAVGGGLYGVLLSRKQMSSAWSGVLFGASLWFLGNETALPVLGLIERDHYDSRDQVSALGEHIVYGIMTDQMFREISRIRR